jgi:hypothetical protein
VTRHVQRDRQRQKAVSPHQTTWDSRARWARSIEAGGTAAIAARDTLKGLIAGFFGLLLAAMGSDWIYATPEALPLSGQPGATTSMSMPGD